MINRFMYVLNFAKNIFNNCSNERFLSLNYSKPLFKETFNSSPRNSFRIVISNRCNVVIVILEE